MCEEKKQIYLDKINYYTSLNDVYKINKYNYKYQELLQLGGETEQDLVNRINIILDKDMTQFTSSVISTEKSGVNNDAKITTINIKYINKKNNNSVFKYKCSIDNNNKITCIPIKKQ
jgi:hypothetical protein